MEAQQKAFVFCTKLPQLTDAKLTSFATFKKQLSYLITLIHFNANCVFWIDLNALKKFKYNMILFYIIKIYKPDNK